MSHSPLDKIQALDAIEKEIITCLQSAGECSVWFDTEMHEFTEKMWIFFSKSAQNIQITLNRVTYEINFFPRPIVARVGQRENQSKSRGK